MAFEGGNLSFDLALLQLDRSSHWRQRHWLAVWHGEQSSAVVELLRLVRREPFCNCSGKRVVRLAQWAAMVPKIVTME